jgi:hypothetical protein
LDMSTLEMISSLQIGQVARLVTDKFNISVIRKGSGFFYKDHPYSEPEKDHLVLNLAAMDHARWAIVDEPSPIFVEPKDALYALLHGVNVRATLNGNSLDICHLTRLIDLDKLSFGLRIQDLWSEVKWEILN